MFLIKVQLYDQEHFKYKTSLILKDKLFLMLGKMKFKFRKFNDLNSKRRFGNFGNHTEIKTGMQKELNFKLRIW